MKWGWGDGGGRREHGDGVHPVPEGRKTSSVVCCLCHGRALQIRWVGGGGGIGLDEWAVADLEVGDRLEEVDKNVITPVE